MWTRRASTSLQPSSSRGTRLARRVVPVALISIALLAGCRKSEACDPFPLPVRPVSPIVSPRLSNEDERDRFKEAETVMKLGDVAPGMTVADIGAGEGYYTVRL